MRRRQDDRVDVGIGERFVVRIVERQMLRRRELLQVVGLMPGHSGDKLEVGAAPLDRFHQGFSPPAHPDNGGVDHFVIRSSENFGSAAWLSVTGRPSSFFTTLTPCTSATIL